MTKHDVVGRAFTTYSKQKRAQIRTVVILTFTLIGCGYMYFVRLEPHPFAQDDYEAYRTIVIYIAFGTILALARAGYYMHLDMPYLNFTKDRFYFDEDETEKGGYWRDVSDISEIEIDDSKKKYPIFLARGNLVIILAMKILEALNPRPKKRTGLVFYYGKDQQFVIDPGVVNLRGEDILSIAKTYWQSSQAKLE